MVTPKITEIAQHYPICPDFRYLAVYQVWISGNTLMIMFNSKTEITDSYTKTAKNADVVTGISLQYIDFALAFHMKLRLSSLYRQFHLHMCKN